MKKFNYLMKVRRLKNYFPYLDEMGMDDLADCQQFKGTHSNIAEFVAKQNEYHNYECFSDYRGSHL